MKRLDKNRKIRVHPSAIKLLTETTWKYAHAILWQQFPFSKEEIALAKIYIKDFYESIPAKKFQSLALTYFRNYRQYIRLAGKFIAHIPDPYITSPAVWLDRTSLKRFCNTKAKPNCLLRKRKNQCLLMEKCKTCPFNSSSPDFHFTV